VTDDITYEEWMAELERLGQDHPTSADGYLSTAELQKLWGVSRNKACVLIKYGMKVGAVDRKTVQGERIDGHRYSYTVYRVKMDKIKDSDP
jgi:hypothetical protein